jgi:hypothetical protein
MIILQTGNLLHTTETYLCHQCNCTSRRANHLSKTVFEAFPYADIYSARSDIKRKFVDIPIDERPGNIVLCGNGKDQRYIVNMLGQMYPGIPKYDTGIDSSIARQQYFISCIQHVYKIIRNSETVAIPWKIGCGAAGGNWLVYSRIIQAYSDINLHINIYIYSLTKLVHLQQLWSIGDHISINGIEYIISDVRLRFMLPFINQDQSSIVYTMNDGERRLTQTDIIKNMSEYPSG